VLDFIHSTLLFHTFATLMLFTGSAIHACQPATRRVPRVSYAEAPPLSALSKPDASNWDFAESYDEAA
jgi:hypothetical protein